MAWYLNKRIISYTRRKLLICPSFSYVTERGERKMIDGK
jgi:hypothetical protein